MKILIVEDDPDLLDVTAYSLRRERFAVIEATDGVQALHRWKVDRPDLIVLDLGLPRHDGFEVLERVREKDLTPVLVLSGRGSEQDIVRAFGLGADDYVSKPFAAKQLALRIRAILRRASVEPLEQSEPTLEIGDLRIRRFADMEVRYHVHILGKLYFLLDGFCSKIRLAPPRGVCPFPTARMDLYARRAHHSIRHWHVQLRLLWPPKSIYNPLRLAQLF